MNTTSNKYLEHTKYGGFTLILIWISVACVVAFFNIPVIRPLVTFPLLLFVPGILILHMLKLNKLDFTVKTVLVVGLSVSFLMFLGLIVSYTYREIGYQTPLYSNSVLITVFTVLFFMTITSRLVNKEPFILNRPTIKLQNTEKLVLFVACLFPLLCITGTYSMDSSSNNTVLIILLTMIPTYVVILAFLRQHISEQVYPLIVYLIGISVSMMLGLRSNHILGADTHEEFLFFTRVTESGHFYIWGNSALDACLSVSILPTIYYQIVGIEDEPLFRLLFPTLFSFTPVIVYILANRYLSSYQSFLASFFFISQYFFVFTEAQSRTAIAVMFFAMFVLVITRRTSLDKMNVAFLSIVFTISMIVSHYSTTYVVFFALLITWLLVQVSYRILVRTKQNTHLDPVQDKPSVMLSANRFITWTFLILIFTVVFFRYGQVTGVAFERGVHFVTNSIVRLNEFFVAESRGGAEAALGSGGVFRDIPTIIEFVFMYTSIFFTSVGLAVMLIKYKQTILPGSSQTTFYILKERLHINHVMPALSFWLILGSVVLIPGLGDYSPERLFILTIVTNAPFLIIGVEVLTKKIIQPMAILLIVILVIFMSNTGITYQIFGVPKFIALNSSGTSYNSLYIYDSEVSTAKWIKGHCARLDSIETLKPWAYSDYPGEALLGSQAKVVNTADFIQILRQERGMYGWLLTREIGAVDGLLLNSAGDAYQLGEYEYRFASPLKLYSNGRSEVWMERWEYSRHWW